MKKKLMSVVLAGAMLISGSAFAFNDVENHWAKPYIDDMKAANVLNQFEGDQILPDQMMTREECAVLISDFFEQFYGYKPAYWEDNHKFIDLDYGNKAQKIRALSLLTYRSVLTSPTVTYPDASEAKIIDGYPSESPNNVEFRPSNNVTRAEFSKMLINSLDCFGYLAQGNAPQIATDADLHWGRGYMMIARALEIVNGYFTLEGDYIMRAYDNGDIIEFPVSSYMEIRPDGNITRAEAIKMVASARDMLYYGLYNVYEGGTRPPSETQIYYLKK